MVHSSRLSFGTLLILGDPRNLALGEIHFPWPLNIINGQTWGTPSAKIVSCYIINASPVRRLQKHSTPSCYFCLREKCSHQVQGNCWSWIFSNLTSVGLLLNSNFKHSAKSSKPVIRTFQILARIMLLY